MAEAAPAPSLVSDPSPSRPFSDRALPTETHSVGQPVLDLGPEPASRREWLSEMWRHRGVTWVLARKDFHVRFKRASFGVLWAVAVPLVQASVMVFVFSHFIHTHRGVPYAPYVLSGILAWTYLSGNLLSCVTSIVDGTQLTDKVWFPRAILALVPCFSGIPGLAISMVILLIGAPIVGAHLEIRILLLVPACLLLVLFVSGFSLVASALYVYFRDVRFIVTALLMMWMYATPIMYPATELHSFGRWLDFNPMTGIITVFRLAVLGPVQPWHRALAVSLIATLLLLAVGFEVHRRRDRLFVDLL